MLTNVGETATNRCYKNSVFTSHFGTPKNALEVYNAVSGKNYPEDTKVQIVTLSDALFMERLNDVAFLIEDKLVVLMEHQSTLNENIPLRMLSYIAREYELMTTSRDLYRDKMVKVPTPEFVVLYNGEKEMEDFAEMRLSEAFELDGDVSLELVVKAYNINKGRNEDILSKSRSLSDYGEFISEVRASYKAGMALTASIRFAVKSCISRGILVDFLARHGSEVENMLFGEWNWDTAKSVWQEEAREEGIAVGEAKGIAIGEARGVLRAARQMKAEGMGFDVISRVTGLSEDEIERLDY